MLKYRSSDPEYCCTSTAKQCKVSVGVINYKVRLKFKSQYQGEVEIAFRPLHPGTKKEVLKVSCPELGIFPMQLHLTGLDAVSHETIHLETDLGSTDTHSIRVPNFSNTHAIFHCRVNNIIIIIIK